MDVKELSIADFRLTTWSSYEVRNRPDRAARILTFQLKIENRQSTIPLGLNSHIANPADQVTACALVCFQGHYFDWVGLVVWTQDQVVPG